MAGGGPFRVRAIPQANRKRWSQSTHYVTFEPGCRFAGPLESTLPFLEYRALCDIRPTLVVFFRSMGPAATAKGFI